MTYSTRTAITSDWDGDDVCSLSTQCFTEVSQPEESLANFLSGDLLADPQYDQARIFGRCRAGKHLVSLETLWILNRTPAGEAP